MVRTIALENSVEGLCCITSIFFRLEVLFFQLNVREIKVVLIIRHFVNVRFNDMEIKKVGDQIDLLHLGEFSDEVT
jgi:hypothetical protein